MKIIVVIINNIPLIDYSFTFRSTYVKLQKRPIWSSNPIRRKQWSSDELLACITIKSKWKLEACIDDEHQFKTAKSPQAHGDATVRKRFFRDDFVTFRHRSKRIAFLESVNFSTCVYMQISNFRDGHVTTFRHPSGPISAKCLVTDSPD